MFKDHNCYSMRAARHLREQCLIIIVNIRGTKNAIFQKNVLRIFCIETILNFCHLCK